MDVNSLLLYATLFTVVVGLWGVAVAAINHRRETNAQIFLELSQRLQNLYRAIPVEQRVAHLTGEELAVEEALISTILLDFLHLMNSGFTLHKAGFISGPLWKALNAEMERGIKLPLFRSFWPRLRGQFSHHPAFVAYVDSLQHGLQ